MNKIFTDTPKIVERIYLDSDAAKVTEGKNGKELWATIDMTFAGLPTNNRIYMPAEMRLGAKTFTTPYLKPLIKNHDKENSEPLGRVRRVKYIDRSQAVMDRHPDLSKKLGLLERKVFDVSPSRKELVEYISAAGAYHTILSREGSEYNGVGHLKGLVRVSDREAIDKIQDERYLTVSVGMKNPKALYCGLCALEGKLTNLMGRKTGCSHGPGDAHGGTPYFTVMSDLSYNELSVVNVPGSNHAKISGYGEEVDLTDSEKSKVYMGGFRFYDSQQDGEKDMKFTLADLISDSTTSYDIVALFLPEDAERLTTEKIADSTDEVFLGNGKTLPLVDKNHIEAVIKALEDVEEASAVKDSLLEEAKARLAALADSTMEETPVVEETPAQPADAAETEAPQETPVEEAANEQAPADSTEEKTGTEEAPAVNDHNEETSKDDTLTDKIIDLEAQLKTLQDSSAAEIASLKQQLDAASIEKNTLDKLHKSASSRAATVTKRFADFQDEIKADFVERLVDAQVSIGLTFTDSAAHRGTLMKRSLQSIRDSLSDLRTGSKPTGAARVPTGEPAPSPFDNNNEQDAPVDHKVEWASKYKEINRQYSKYYLTAPKKAAAYLKDMKSQGIVPVDFVPSIA